jgi:hypothetical protein
MDFRNITISGGGQVNLGSGNTNVGRDQVVVTLAGDVDALGTALRGLPLTDAQRAEAQGALDAFRSSARDKPAAGEHLRRFTKVLRDTGALAAAGATVLEPLGRIARWLGPLGTAVLALL